MLLHLICQHWSSFLFSSFVKDYRCSLLLLVSSTLLFSHASFFLALNSFQRAWILNFQCDVQDAHHTVCPFAALSSLLTMTRLSTLNGCTAFPCCSHTLHMLWSLLQDDSSAVIFWIRSSWTAQNWANSCWWWLSVSHSPWHLNRLYGMLFPEGADGPWGGAR